MKRTNLTSSDDMNNIITEGWYVIANANAPANCPSWGGYNSIILVKRFNAYVIQFMADNNTRNFGYRIGEASNISDYSWYLITATAE